MSFVRLWHRNGEARVSQFRYDQEPLRPLVAGLPRSGYSLLGSVLSHFLPLCVPREDLRQSVLNATIGLFGEHPALCLVKQCAEHGQAGGLVYSPAFRTLTGGPKWLHPERPDTVLVRKYVGVRGLGDFSLVLSHPREVLDSDAVVQSHVDAVRWLEIPEFRERQKFVSIRNPLGVVNSALLSLNALTSEYIQNFLPRGEDTPDLRQRLALYKFSDLEFFSGIVRYCRAWFDTFLPAQDAYTVMRWEDLIREPVKTICKLADALDLPVDADHAGQIWASIGHRNLTESHGHNYRPGGGRVGDWKNWLTNTHLDIMRQHGFNEIMSHFGYEPIRELPRHSRTDFQVRMDELLARNEIYIDYEDQDLFCFAFNKSNIDASHFLFQRYGWRNATQMERAQFSDEKLLESCWEVADQATARLNAVFECVLAQDYSTQDKTRMSLRCIDQCLRASMLEHMPRAVEACMSTLEALVESWFKGERHERAALGGPPRLIRAAVGHNIVKHGGRFIVVPHAAGPLDLSGVDVKSVPGAFCCASYQEALDGLSMGASLNAHAVVKTEMNPALEYQQAATWPRRLLPFLKRTR